MNVYKMIRTEKALKLHLISSPDRDTGALEEKGTCPKSHGTRGIRRFYLEPRLSAPWRVGGSRRRVRPYPTRAG